MAPRSSTREGGVKRNSFLGPITQSTKVAIISVPTSSITKFSIEGMLAAIITMSMATCLTVCTSGE